MPFKDPEKRKQYYLNHAKAYNAEWKKKNKDKLNEYQRERQKKRTENGFGKIDWEKLKQNPERYEKVLQSSRNYRNKNREALNKKYRELAKELDDEYVIKQLIKEGVSKERIKQDYELIKKKKVSIAKSRIVKIINKIDLNDGL